MVETPTQQNLDNPMTLLSASGLGNAMRKHPGEAGSPVARRRRDATAMGLSDGTCDGQAQPGAIRVRMGSGSIGAGEAVEQPGQGLGIDVGASVGRVRNFA